MKTAIVTGTNRGIGLGIIEELARNHINVWACARKQTTDFEEKLYDLSKQTGTAVRPIYFDIRDSTSVKNAVMNIYKESGSIDILVNNAGICTESLFLMTSIEKMKELFDVNFFSLLGLTQIVIRYMRKNSSGSIINIASVSGIQNEIGRLAYGSSKAALIFSTRTLAMELGQYGIRVNSISPGFIDTDLWKNRDKTLKEKVLAETPIQRQGRTEDIARAVIFLAGDDASYITGTNLIIDGGRIA